MPITWKVENLEVINKNGLEDVVVMVRLLVVGEEDGNRAEQQVSASLPPPDPASFVAFSGITEAQILEWAKASLGRHYDLAERRVSKMLAARKATPPKVVKPPWA